MRAILVSIAVAGAWLAALAAANVVAEESTASQPPVAAAPAPPDGFYVTPPRPIPVPLTPDLRARGGLQPNLPQQAPQGGCPYNGRKLDLIV